MYMSLIVNNTLKPSPHLKQKKATAKQLLLEFQALINGPQEHENDRRQQLIDLEHRVKKLRQCPTKETLLRKITRALFVPNNIHSNFHLNCQALATLTNVTEKEQIHTDFFKHLVLDSLYPYYPERLHTDGEYSHNSLALIKKYLEEFAVTTPHPDQFKPLIKALGFGLKLSLLILSKEKSNPLYQARNPEYVWEFLKQQLLKLQTKSEAASLLVETGTDVHSVALKITHSKESGYCATLFNTGDEAEDDDETGNYASLHFTGLKIEQFKPLPHLLFHQPKTYKKFIYKLKSSICLNNNCEKKHSYKGQKGDSCVSKSITCFLKHSMEEVAYREFKVFLTKKLMEKPLSPFLMKLGAYILEKRALKVIYYQIQKGLQEFSASPNKLEAATYLQRILETIEGAAPYHENVIENAISTSFYLLDRIEELTDPDNLPPQ